MTPNVETTSSHTALYTAAGYSSWVRKPNTIYKNRINEILRNLQERKTSIVETTSNQYNA